MEETLTPMTSYLSFCLLINAWDRCTVGSMWGRYKVDVLRCLYFSLTLFADRIESVQ